MDNPNARFQARHLGAAPGSLSNFFTPSYRESETADQLIYLSFLSIWIIIPLILIIAISLKFRGLGGLMLLCAALCVGISRGLILAARYVNNADVRRKIRESVTYAQYFAVKYPAQAQLCEQLNPDFSPDFDRAAVPKSPEMPMWERVRSFKLGRVTAAATYLCFTLCILSGVWMLVMILFAAAGAG